MTPKPPRVLVVEDDPSMQRFLCAALDAHGHRVVLASTLAEARYKVVDEALDLILLDLGLPDGDGLVFLPWLRERYSLPVVVLSARGLERDKIAALDSGADDYLTKPFGIGELLARVRVSLRRARPSEGPTPTELVVGPLQVDLNRRQVTIDGRVIHLTPLEYRLLLVLARHPGCVMTHRQILTEVWGPPYSHQTHYVRVHMAELRKKVEPDPARPRFLLTEQGVGYRWADPISAS